MVQHFLTLQMYNIFSRYASFWNKIVNISANLRQIGYLCEDMRRNSKKNRLVRADSLSRSHTIDISWEHGAFFDVGDAEEAGGDALQADGEAAVRGHAVAEGVEVEMERIGVHATTEHLIAVVGFFMDTLSAGGDLEATHE